MLQKILNFLFGTDQSVDSVLVKFNKTLDDLKSVEQKNTAAAENHAIEIAQSQAAQEAATNEARRARAVAARIEAMVNPDLAVA